MKHIDGEKIELVIEEIYEIFKKHSITGHEGAAISSMILCTSTSLVVNYYNKLEKELLKKKDTNA